MIKKYKSYTMK